MNKRNLELENEIAESMQKFLAELPGRQTVKTASVANPISSFAGELASIASDLEQVGEVELAEQADQVLAQFAALVAPESK